MKIPFTNTLISNDFIYAILLLIGGLYLISFISKIVKRRLEKTLTPPLPYFLSAFLRIGLSIVLLISVLGKLGIPTNSFVAVLGAAGLAVGLALQGHLSNLAGGILILVFKPFAVGDRITAMDETGVVTEIKAFFTILKTANKQTLYLPNGPLFSGVLINHTEEGFSRVEYEVGVSYTCDLDKAIAAIEGLLNEREEVLKDQPIQIFVSQLADSSVNLSIFFYVENEIFWDVRYLFLKLIKQRLDREGIEIPFPQRVIHQA